MHEQLKVAAEKLGQKVESFALTKPASQENGDLATNLAMILAKDLKKSPMDVAKELVDGLSKSDFIENVEIKAPGFINFFFRKDFLVGNLGSVLEAGESFGKSDFGKNQKVVLEHTNVNPNKALHIGHLRNACLGSACERILEHLDYNVEAEYYVDDTGVQVAVTYLGIKKLEGATLENQKYDHFAQDIYVKTMDLIEKDPEYKTAQEEIISELDKQDGSDVLPAKEFASKVILSNLVTMHNLEIDYDLMVWESDIIKRGFWATAFEILKKNNNAFVKLEEGKNAGCWVIKNVLGEDKVIVKSNGVATYTGKDIAYHFWKFNLLGKDFLYKEWHGKLQEKPLFTTTPDGTETEQFGRADIVVNFIDVRQTFPQQAVVESLKALGYKNQAQNLKHVGYGIVFLSPKTAKELGIDTSENKTRYAMSGRKGIGILADDLFDLVSKKIKEQYPESEVSKEVSIAAIKFHMLKYNTLSDIVFDLDQALDFHGNSGPYLQYTFARTQSILRKAKEFGKEINNHTKYENASDEEKELMSTLLSFSSAVNDAGKEFAPQLLCNYLFELSQKFNTYYSKNIIVSTKEANSQDDFRILLTAAIGQVLKNGLYLLGIPALEKM